MRNERKERQTPIYITTKDILIFSPYNNKEMNNFDFQFSGYGHYKVTYTSPVTGKKWSTVTNNMPLIDATKNCDSPLKKDLNTLKNLCKDGQPI